MPPARAREVLFCARADRPTRAEALASAAATLGVPAPVIEQSLFADLHGERLVRAPEAIPAPQDLALRVNQLIVRALLARAGRVRIQAEGSVRPLVRQAKLRGLLCSVTQARPPVLDLSGPFALFRHTLLYGRALGELVAFLPHCGRFSLQADCVLRGEKATLHLESGDPIFPAEAARPYDSRLEERFARDFRRAAPAWDLVREPEPVAAAGTLIFPDFLVRERLRPDRAFFLEIVGFWSPAYLARKLALLRQARLDRLILCVDEARACADGEWPADARLVRFRRRVDPTAVLAAAATFL